jgi:hypothetical protein
MSVAMIVFMTSYNEMIEGGELGKGTFDTRKALHDSYLAKALHFVLIGVDASTET